MLTVPETLSQATFEALAHILNVVCDRDLCAEPDAEANLDGWNSDLVQSLEKHVESVEEMKGLVPALQSTLHALYTAHEVGIAVLGFCAYVARQGKNVYEKQVEANTKIKETAEKLLVVVEGKCRDVKKGVDEGGWIDRVLECVLPDEGAGGEELVKGLKELADENFMEAWAGEVVESWKDSIVGLALLKGSSA